MSGGPPAQQLPQPTIQTVNPVVVYAAHSKHYLDGFNTGRSDVLTGNGPYYEDVYCDRNGGEASQEAGVSLTGKACDEWTNGYDTGFNTCAFTPRCGVGIV